MWDVKCRFVTCILFCWILSVFFFFIFQDLFHESALFSVKAFSASVEMVKWFLSLNILMWWMIAASSHMLNAFGVPGMMPTWSWRLNFHLCCQIQLASVLLRIFGSLYILEIGLWFFWLFCYYAISGFGVLSLSYVYIMSNSTRSWLWFWITRMWAPVCVCVGSYSYSDSIFNFLKNFYTDC